MHSGFVNWNTFLLIQNFSLRLWHADFRQRVLHWFWRWRSRLVLPGGLHDRNHSQAVCLWAIPVCYASLEHVSAAEILQHLPVKSQSSLSSGHFRLLCISRMCTTWEHTSAVTHEIIKLHGKALSVTMLLKGVWDWGVFVLLKSLSVKSSSRCVSRGHVCSYASQRYVRLDVFALCNL